MPLPRRSPLAPRRLLSALLAGVSVLTAGGCRAVDVPPPPVPPAPPSLLHWPVPAPAPLAAADPVLWVALAARLVPQGDPGAAPPLRLRSAAGSLSLSDAAGQRFSAPELSLHWRRLPLAEPLLVRRQVQGPFASYESAEQAARAWQAPSGTVRIAKSRDWEVWAPPGVAAPEGVGTRLVERRESAALTLELRRAGATVALKGPLRLEAPGGLAWKGGVYAGPFRLQSDAHGGWTLLEMVPLERYLEGVVPHEIGSGSPPAALAAQAVLARTWAVRNRHRYVVDGYHLCADTQCQVYSDPRLASAPVRQAIAATRHQVLAWRNEPIHAVYHATNGGVAAGLDEVWSAAPLPYLQPFLDGPPAFQGRWSLPLAPAGLASLLRGGQAAYGSDHPRFRWQRRLSAAGIAAALGADAAAVGTVQRLEVRQRGPSGRVMTLEIAGSAGSLQLRRDAIRRTLRDLPSTLFTIAPAGPGVWLVQGGGFGHGAGLSQAGAIDLGRRGWSSAEILRRYYPGTSLEPLRALGEAP
ncbi:MAG: SpoIID/LytB domain-containing protein [Cyanobium sp.]